MARVKTFRIHPDYGVPDKDIREFLNTAEKEDGNIFVQTALIPAVGAADPRLTIIVTKAETLLPFESDDEDEFAVKK